MGRSGKRGKKFKHGGNKQKGERKPHQHIDYPKIEKSNKEYEEYYQLQGIVPETEWEAFLEAMKEPLPTTFRITAFRGEAQEMLKIIKDKYISNLVSTGQDCPVHSLPWYPNELGWQIDLSRKDIAKKEHFASLKDFLLNETESGNISRQEAVSMIPPLILDVKPHHKVLDMCAAPGSKTAQLIESLHAEGDNVPDGYVIANDVDNKRCYLMVHQVKRLQSPCCAIVNHDASTLPNIKIGDGLKDFVQYDRVLCDVPCSGDGTLRKNVDIWKKWNTNTGPNLHKIQMKILKRGLELLAVGGRLVYSTCSLNPIENEAVIASVVDKCKGCIELIDVSKELPNLKYCKGLSSWKVYSKKMEEVKDIKDSWDKGFTHYEASMFPPENAKDFNLDRCVRVLPHHQNTGGFFIVAIRKTDILPWMRPVVITQEVKTEEPVKNEESSGNQCNTSTEPVKDAGAVENKETETGNKCDKDELVNEKGDTKEKVDESANNKDSPNEESKTGGKRPAEEHKEPPPTKHKRMHGYKEDPFLFLESNDPFWEPIQKFYGIRKDFPVDQVMYRAETGQKRTIYFVSSALKNVVKRNSDRLRFINLGLRIFGRSSSPLVPDCDFRISQEGLSVLGSECITRSVEMTRDDMITFMTYDNPFFTTLSAGAREKLKQISIGCLLITYKPEEGETKPSCNITVCGWRGKNSIRTFLSKNLRAHYLRLFGLELSELLKTMAKNKSDKEKDQDIDSGDNEIEENKDIGAENEENVEENADEGIEDDVDDMETNDKT